MSAETWYLVVRIAGGLLLFASGVGLGYSLGIAVGCHKADAYWQGHGWRIEPEGEEEAHPC